MKKPTLIILSLITILIIQSCSASKFSRLRSTNLEMLNLGMKKEELISILGTAYTITEKKKENDKILEVLSYRNFPYENEHYLFHFANGSLTAWHREFEPTLKED